MKRFLSLWMFLLCFIGGAFADEVMINFPDKWSSTTDMTELSASDLKWGDIQLAFSGGTNTSNVPKYYNSGSAVRIYSKNTMTITAPAAKPITEIVFLFAEGYEAEAGNFSAGSFSGTTWTGSASEIVLTNSKSSGQIRVCSMKITYGGDAPAPGPQKAEGALIDYPVAKDGITIKTTDDSQVKYTTVKIHNNTDAVECLQFGKSFKISDTEYYYALLETEGGFKAGDVISIAGVFNNADDTKQAAIAVYSDPTKAAIWTTENFINGRTSADDPVAQTFTLTEPAEKLYIGRKGGTATSITDLKVLRGFITISPAPGDIYAAYNAAVDGIADIKKVTINLEKGGAYTISQSLVASASLVINGNGAIIDASSMEGPMITMADGSLADAKAVEAIAVNDATIKGLKKALFYSPGKNYNIAALNISNSVIELAADATTIDFTKGSVAMTVSIDNSTIYAPTATTKSFYSSQSGEKASDYGATEAAPQVFSFTNSTFVNLAPTKNFFSHRQNSQKWLKYVAKNNIFVDCGKSGQVIKGMNGGGSSKNPQFDIDGNAFNFGGADTSGAEATGDSDEPIKSSIAGIVFFTDAANGDFGGTFAYDTEAAPAKAPGDPRWSLAVKEHYQTIWSSEEPVEVTWGGGAFIIPAEKFADAKVGDNLIVKIIDAQVYTNPWDAQVALKSPRDGWPDLEGISNIGNTTPTEVAYVLTGDILAEVKKNGLVIAGNNFKTNRVSIEATSTTGSENSIWIGEQIAHLYLANCHFANANNFKGVKVNDIIRVTIKEPTWVGLAYNKGWDWTTFAESDIETINDYTNPVVDFVIKTEAAAKEMNDKANNNGVIINTGAGAVPLQVELISYIDIANMNDLEDKEEFTFTAEAVVIAKETKGNHVYVYIQDNSGTSLIYDNDGSKTADLEVGKTIQAGWKGQVSYYNGLFEVVPQEALAVTAAPTQEIVYPTASSIKNVNANNVNKIFKFTNLTFADVNNANFNVKRGNQEVAGYNQFDGVMIGEGLVCDEVIAAIGIYNGTVQLQPISIKMKTPELVVVTMPAGGDISEAVAAAKSGKNPSDILLALGHGNYTVSAPIITPTGINIIGAGAGGDKGDGDATVIDASGLTGPMVKLAGSMTYAKKSDNTDSNFLQYGSVIFGGVKVKGLNQPLVEAANTDARADVIEVNSSVVEVSGNKNLFNLGRLFADNTIIENTTLYSVEGHTGYLIKSDGRPRNLENGYPNGVSVVLDKSTLYQIAKGMQLNNSNGQLKGQAYMNQKLTNSLLVLSGNAEGNTIRGWQFGQQSATPTMAYGNNTYWGDPNDVYADLSANWISENGGDQSGTVVDGKPLFRKDITQGLFTLGICPQIGKQVGDPRWYNIPAITALQNALHRAASLLDGAQADWQTAPATDEAIEKLAGAYNENTPYLNSNYQEAIDEATERVEKAIAEFEMVYGSSTTAIKAIDAAKADGTWYTVNGQRISKPTEKGIYIHNGKKVVVK